MNMAAATAPQSASKTKSATNSFMLSAALNSGCDPAQLPFWRDDRPSGAVFPPFLSVELHRPPEARVHAGRRTLHRPAERV